MRQIMTIAKKLLFLKLGSKDGNCDPVLGMGIQCCFFPETSRGYKAIPETKSVALAKKQLLENVVNCIKLQGLA